MTDQTAPEQQFDDSATLPYNDDVVVEEDTEISTDPLKKLRHELKSCREEKQGYLDGWQRLRADFANYKKREEEDRQRAERKAIEKIIKDILPTLDSFEMAMSNKDAWESVDPGWRSGVEYIRDQLLNGLKRHGFAEVTSSPGDVYDAQIATALSVLTTTIESQHHTVARVVQKGYTLDEKLIRSPQVEVYEFSLDEIQS